jgi:NADPH-dependent curcumin reductase CurA
MTPTGRLRTGAQVHRETGYEGLESAPRAPAEMISGHTIGTTPVRTT